MFVVPPAFRARALATGAALLAMTVAAPAFADCQTDIQGFMKRRDGVIAQLNQMTHGAKGKKLDPIAACPKFKALTGILNQTVAYLEKNKDWCSIPDSLLDGAKGQRGQFSKTASQACGIAAKIAVMKKRAQQQAAQGGMAGPQVQQLPHGPL